MVLVYGSDLAYRGYYEEKHNAFPMNENQVD